MLLKWDVETERSGVPFVRSVWGMRTRTDGVRGRQSSLAFLAPPSLPPFPNLESRNESQLSPDDGQTTIQRRRFNQTSGFHPSLRYRSFVRYSLPLATLPFAEKKRWAGCAECHLVTACLPAASQWSGVEEGAGKGKQTSAHRVTSLNATAMRDFARKCCNTGEIGYHDSVGE